MTADNAKGCYERELRIIAKLKAELKEARARATTMSREYGRLCREELRQNSKPPAGQGEGEK